MLNEEPKSNFDQDEPDREIRFEPKQINNPDCEHEYKEVGLDPEGVMQAQCTKCWFGRRYRPNEYECRDGRIVAKNAD